MSDAELSHDVTQAIDALKLVKIRPPSKLLYLVARDPKAFCLWLNRPDIVSLLIAQ